MAQIHLAGIGGSGMLPLAELLLKKGLQVSGSDRLITDPKQLENLSPPIQKRMKHLQLLGAILYPQDGSGITETTKRLVVSTAIEDTNPEVIAAHAMQITILHRSQELSNQINQSKLLAVAGTSGKSTTSALCGWILKSTGQLECFVGGAEILEEGKWSAVHVAQGEWSCLELDESDRSLLNFHPQHSVILNITRDHHTYEENIDLFIQFAEQTTGTVLLNSEDSGCQELAEKWNSPEKIQWFTPPANDESKLTPSGVDFHWQEQNWQLPLLGQHNAENASAALSLIKLALPDCKPQDLQNGLKTFPGVRRRLHRYGKGNTAVYDDYAHNPEKIKALLTTLQQHYERVCLIFQPHGYTPLRFHMDETSSVCQSTLRSQDVLILLPVYDAGGTTKRDISSHNLKEKIGRENVYVIEKRDEVIQFLISQDQPFTAISTAGARDDSLAEFAATIAERVD